MSENAFPGPHTPLPPEKQKMVDVVRALEELFPGCFITLFVADKKGTNGQLPRFNYASSVNREDMLNVLKAFIERQEGEKLKLSIIDKPGRGSA